MKGTYDTVQQAPGMAQATHQTTAGGGVVPTTGQRLLEVGRALAGAAATPAGRVAVGVAETAAVQGTNWAQAPVVPRRVGGRGIGRGATGRNVSDGHTAAAAKGKTNARLGSASRTPQAAS